jgi:hypothetical protein
MESDSSVQRMTERDALRFLGAATLFVGPALIAFFTWYAFEIRCDSGCIEGISHPGDSWTEARHAPQWYLLLFAAVAGMVSAFVAAWQLLRNRIDGALPWLAGAALALGVWFVLWSETSYL